MADRGLPAASGAVVPSATGTMISPGFRFNPTDEELISYYLKRKVQRKPFPLDLIGEIDVYNHEPSALPEQSKMKTREREWFFFTSVEKLGKRIKRGTAKGYWRQRGLEKNIRLGGGDVGQVIGKVKRLVFDTNNKPTNWVIHEYHLVDNNDDGHAFEPDAYVLCRLSDTSGNINAPFSEEEWDDDGRALVHANRINEEIQQESDFGIKNLFDLNELPGEFDLNEDPKTVDQDDACPLPCALNKEASLPLIQFKRKRQIDSSGSYANSSQTTHQDHCSSPKPTSQTIPSTILEESEPEPVNTTMVAPTSSSYTELIKVLQKERQQFAAEGKRYELDMTNAQMVISDLVGKNNALRMEIEELKKKNSNKEQGS